VPIVSAAILFFGCRYSFERAVEIGRVPLDDEDRPDDLLILQPAKREFLINLKTVWLRCLQRSRVARLCLLSC
jgi:hypothetical protein